MPTALATAATDRSISAVRITKVRPTAMMPVIDTCDMMLKALSTVRKDGLAIEKKTMSAKSVKTGAILRN